MQHSPSAVCGWYDDRGSSICKGHINGINTRISSAFPGHWESMAFATSHTQLPCQEGILQLTESNHSYHPNAMPSPRPRSATFQWGRWESSLQGISQSRSMERFSQSASSSGTPPPVHHPIDPSANLLPHGANTEAVFLRSHWQGFIHFQLTSILVCESSWFLQGQKTNQFGSDNTPVFLSFQKEVLWV